MNAQQKSNDQYTQYCAQYADLGFKIDGLIAQRRAVKKQIDALNATVPLILQAEADAKKEAQETANGKTGEFPRATTQEARHKQ